MYESFFGLNEKPFNLTPDPRYFYLSEGHREALAALIYGVRERAGLITLSGPVGVGKTMILASFLDQIREHAETASFSGALSGNRLEFLKDLCSVLGITPEQDSLFGVSQAVKDFAIRKAGEGRSVVVLVDEAQDLGPEELEHFHHLSNLETPEAKLVQIVLAGTEKLDERLREESLEALWQRVAIRCAIKPIEPEETVAYIFHRMRVAGSSSSELFSDDALWRIVNFARGVPRLINLVCNQAMISAYSSGRVPVDEDAVLEALKELGGGHSGSGTGERVGKDEIRGMVGTVSRGREEEAPQEGEKDPGANEREDSQGKAEAEEQEGITLRRRRWLGFFSRFFPGSRFAPVLVLVISLAMVGVVMAIGLLRTRDDVVERAEVVLLEEPEEGWKGDSPEQSDLGYGIPRGGPERVGEENEVAEARPGLLALGRPESEEAPAGSRGKRWMVLEKDVAGIALEHYGRLDVEMLKVLREKNPQIRDWNNLTENVQLMLPDMPEPTNGGVDFYTIQVGAFREEGGASRRASDLAKKGSQNLFLVKGGVEKRLTFVCAGVFESWGQSRTGVRQMQEWGYEDAFPLRIRAKRLEDILVLESR
jgi:general secretion pathway protein A